jgi:uncharacterized protein YjbI with pentapeptide repeats
MQKLNAKKLMLLIVLCLVGWQAFVWDGYLQKVDVAYAAWRHPDQSGSDWSHFIFTSKIPVLYNLNLSGKNFNNASFVNGGLYHTHFENTKFIHAKMKNSHFEQCIFKQCD